MIENIYIIHQNTGVCLIHRSYGIHEYSQDILSVLLTTLKDFAVDLSEGKIGPMKLADFKITTIYKEGILIAATLEKDDDPEQIDSILKSLLDNFIEKYSSEIEEWLGDVRIFQEYGDTIDAITNKGNVESLFDSEIEPPFDAYEGNEPYLFVSYAHFDKMLVYPIIEELYKQGVRIWYDEGIPAASDWIAEIAETIINSECFLVFVTPRALKSEHVRDEIHLAKDEKKKMFVIYLEDTELPPDIRLQIGRKQALFWHKMSEERFWKKLKNQLSEVINTLNSEQELIRVDGSSKQKTLNMDDTNKEELHSPKSFESSKIKNGIFVSYSHRDRKWLEVVHVFLKPLIRSGDISYWDDSFIKPGEDWEKKTEDAIKSAKVIIPLISAYYLASDFILNDELPRLFEVASEQGTRIIPLIISPSRFNRKETLNRYQAINDPYNEALESLSKGKQDEVLVRLADAVEDVFKS